MQSKTSFFDWTLARKGLRRTMPLWLTHLVIWVFAMPIMVVNLGPNVGNILDMSEYIYYTVHIGGTLMAFFFCAAIVEVQNSYLCTARSVSFYHALPVRRGTIFCTNTLLTLAVLLVPMVLVAAMTLAIEYSLGLGGGLIYLVKWLGMYAAMCLFFTGFATLCSHITGHVAAAPILYVVLNFTVVVVEWVVRYIPTLFLYGVSFNGSTRLGWMSPIWHIYTECCPQMEYTEDMQPLRLFYDGSGYLWGLALCGLVLLALAWLFYRRRQSESAGEFVAVPALRPVFKYCVTAGCTLLLSILFYAVSYQIRSDARPSVPWYTVCMLIAGAIGYFGSEMVLRKSFRVFRSWKGFAAAALVILLCGGVLGFDLLGVESYVPQASEVAYVELQSYYNQNFRAKVIPEDPCFDNVLALHRLILDNKETSQNLVYDWYAGTSGSEQYDYDYIRLDYYMNDGSTVGREYYLPIAAEAENDGEIQDIFGYLALVDSIYETPEVIRRAYSVLWDDAPFYQLYYGGVQLAGIWDDEDVLSYTVYADLLEALRADLLEGSLVSNRNDYYYSAEAEDGQRVFCLNLEFERRSEEDPVYRSYEFYVTPEAARTWAVLNDPASYQEQPDWAGEAHSDLLPADSRIGQDTQVIFLPARPRLPVTIL